MNHRKGKLQTLKAITKWKEMGDETVRKVIDVIKKHPEGITTEMITKKTGASRTTINSCLKRSGESFTTSYVLQNKHIRKVIMLTEDAKRRYTVKKPVWPKWDDKKK